VQRARHVFGKLPPQPVECNDGTTTLWVSDGGARGASEVAGGMDGCSLWCGGGGGTTKKKETAPFPRFGVWGAPSLCVYVCVCVFHSGVVSVVCEGRGQGIPYLFFSSLLFSLYRRCRRNHRTPTTPDDADDVEHLLSPPLTSHSAQKGRPRREHRVGEKNLHEMTHIFLLIFSFPLVAVMHQHHYSVFDFYSFPNVGRDRVVVFPTKPNHHVVRPVIHHACRWPTF